MKMSIILIAFALFGMGYALSGLVPGSTAFWIFLIAGGLIVAAIGVQKGR
jgi:hypothetical protein